MEIRFCIEGMGDIGRTKKRNWVGILSLILINVFMTMIKLFYVFLFAESCVYTYQDI